MKSIGLLDELIVDNFAGGGGASTGIELALGRPVDIAINHDPDAIAMHKANHPYTQHYCESVWDIDPRKATGGRSVGLAWFSPDCKHFSKAKGGKPVDKNIRGLAWVAVRWAATVRPRVIILENVEEFKTWGPVIAMRDKVTGRLLKKVFRDEDDDSDVLYDMVVAEPDEIVPPELQIIIPDIKQKGRTFNSFVNALRRHGYTIEWRELRACDYGAPTIRKRFFLVARCDGAQISWPEPTHGDPKSAAVKDGRLKPWRTAAEIIDWSIPCPSIFERDRPLAENTMRRIARGLKKFVLDNPEPFIVQVNHGGDVFRGQTTDEPLQTVTAKHGYGIVTPYISRIGQTGFGGDRMSYSAEDPVTTVTSKAEHLLVSPYLTKFQQNSLGQEMEQPIDTVMAGATRFGLIAPTLIQVGYGEAPGQAPRVPGLDKPVGTITAGGNKFALVSAFMAKHYGGGYTGPGNTPQEPISTITAADHNALVTSHMIKMKGTNCGQPAGDPLQTITAGGLHFGEIRAFLLKYYGQGTGQECSEPLHTIKSHDVFGLVTVAGEQYQIADIGMRMLEPHELYAAQGFPSDYKIDFDIDGKKYSKAAQVARCGNAVPPPFAEALVRANLPEMAYRTQLGTMRQLDAAINE